MTEQQKKIYGAFGAATFLHVTIIGFFSIKAALILNLVFAVALLVILWRATQGRRGQLLGAITMALCLEAVAWGFAYYAQLGVEEREEKFIRFQAPPPILEKNFDLAKKPEISEVQMEMLASMGPPDLPDDISAIADVSAIGSDLLGAVLPGSQVLGTFSGAKAEELAFDDVEMIELTETAAPVQEAVSLRQELLNVQDLDFGRYQAILIQDPENKRNIRGFFNMSIIDYDLADKNNDRFPTATEELMRYMRDNTQINARIEGTTLRLSDANIFKQPLLYMTGNNAVFPILRHGEGEPGRVSAGGWIPLLRGDPQSRLGGQPRRLERRYGRHDLRPAIQGAPQGSTRAGRRWRSVATSAKGSSPLLQFLRLC